MERLFCIGKRKIRYSIEGQGLPVMLLHGYLESLEIWKELSEVLSKQFRVIAIDLPGHGKSTVTSGDQTINEMAEVVQEILKANNISNCVLIGHSMGGYVALSFGFNYPSLLNGLCLMHSTPFADNEEKIKSRNREIELVKNGKKVLICNSNIPRAFADNNLDNFEKEIKDALSIAVSTSDEGIIAALNAMKKRKDMSKYLENIQIPFLLFLGKSDNYINFDSVGNKISIPVNGKKIVLEKSGHMGFIEEKDVVIKNIIEFLNSINK
jgi:pimeloyl-ACP methyl ester carboxylesterase